MIVLDSKNQDGNLYQAHNSMDQYFCFTLKLINWIMLIGVLLQELQYNISLCSFRINSWCIGLLTDETWHII